MLTEQAATSPASLSWSWSYFVFPSPIMAEIRGHWYACRELAYLM
jgi:hypothetical protein